MKLSPLKKKRAAIELGVGTMVVIVIAVVLLVLALVFVRRIFVGATYNVDQLNDAVRSKINQLFSQEDRRVIAYLPGQTLTLSQGEDFGLAFGVRNDLGREESFKYIVRKDSRPAQCSTDDPEKWIILRKEGSFRIPSGGVEYGLVRIRVPRDENVGCFAPFKIEVFYTNNKIYGSYIFDIKVKARSIGGLLG